ncbi:MAG: aminodeoxychorismate synthase component I [Chlorobium sp.]
MSASATFERIAGTLSGDGSLWFESAFCKGLNAEALLFSTPLEVITLLSLSGLEEFFCRLEEKVAEGFFLAGWLGYEAGAGFEPSLCATYDETQPHSPLGWFGVYREPERFSAGEVAEIFADDRAFSDVLPEDLAFNLSEEEFREKLSILKDEIAAGNVYQVNFTGRYRFSFSGSAPALFGALRAAQPSSFTAFLKTGERTILSFSPELFFQKRGSVIETRPMKGTAPRGVTSEEDSRLREGLAGCKKNRAENLMIVDLLRNDLGRICKPGSVGVAGLFATESYPTLHQMVSTIRGEEREGVGLYELFRALFPCGSVTGAPKIKAMKLIQALEPEPRGIYTGAIGFITPDRDMLFNVAIRTLELSGTEGLYGSGSGIVWDSDAGEEFRECQLKAKILGGSTFHSFGLFESILWNRHYLWLEEHLARLASSASQLGFPCEKSVAVELLRQLEGQMRLDGNHFKVRLDLSCLGVFTARFEPFAHPGSGAAVRLCLAGERTDSSNLLLCHKTTRRELYDRYYTLAREKGYDEVLFLNERGEVTEGAISSLFIRKGQQFLTPPLHCGLLDGIFRRYFLSTRPFAKEKIVTLDDLKEAEMICIANSVRGLRTAVFSGDEILL